MRAPSSTPAGAMHSFMGVGEVEASLEPQMPLDVLADVGRL